MSDFRLALLIMMWSPVIIFLEYSSNLQFVAALCDGDNMGLESVSEEALSSREQTKRPKLSCSRKKKPAESTARQILPELIMKSRILRLFRRSFLLRWQHCIKWDGTLTRVVRDGCALEELMDLYVVRKLFSLILIRKWPWRDDSILST